MAGEIQTGSGLGGGDGGLKTQSPDPTSRADSLRILLISAHRDHHVRLSCRPHSLRNSCWRCWREVWGG